MQGAQASMLHSLHSRSGARASVVDSSHRSRAELANRGGAFTANWPAIRSHTEEKLLLSMRAVFEFSRCNIRIILCWEKSQGKAGFCHAQTFSFGTVRVKMEKVRITTL
ncbi:unnamed protein product [Ectocarpus sp. 4 AP-2014]